MDRREYLDRLDATATDLEDLFEHFEQQSARGLTYHALSEPRHGLERGTVIFEDVDAVVRVYPSIPRTLVIEPGVETFFADAETVTIEETVDGFNVRIVDVGEPIAFTRSGYVCPFSTTRARTRLDLEEFFKDHPDAMICAELVGPETPYSSTGFGTVDSSAFRVFGIRDRETGEPLPVTERRERCAAYDFPQPRQFGRSEPSKAAASVRSAIAELHATGREGVVLRSADGLDLLKYTTESQHHDELVYAFRLPFERGRDFVFSRIVRDAFQAMEFEEDPERLEARAHELGESILLPMVETIRNVDRGEPVGDRHTVRGRPSTIDSLLSHLRDQSLTLEIEFDQTDDERVVTFRKVAESTRDRIQHYLDGGTVDE